MYTISGLESGWLISASISLGGSIIVASEIPVQSVLYNEISPLKICTENVNRHEDILEEIR